MQRRLAMLAGFTFRIIHVSGNSEEISISDYLSRWGPFEIKTTNAQTQTDINNVDNQSCPIRGELNNSSQSKQKRTSADQSSQTFVLNEKHHTSPLIKEGGESESDSNMTDYDSQDSEELNDKPTGHIDSIKLQNVLLQTAETETIPITLKDVRGEYDNDKLLGEVINWVKNNKKPIKIDSRSSHREIFHYWKNFNLLTFNDGILYIKRINATTKKHHKVIVLPYTLIQRALYSYHNTISNCHPGVDNSYDLCRKKFYFYKMRKEFEIWINACLVCNKTKQTQAFRKAPLKPIVYNHPFQAISIDHLEVSKTPTPRGNRALLTITDMFSSYLVCIPVKSTKAEVTIQKIIEHWILKFGVFNVIHHDLGSGFTSQLFKAILKVFNIKDKPGTSFHSQTQGKIESQNRRLNMCYRACLSDKDFKNYDLYAKYITFVLNSLKSTRTGYSAHYLVHGHEPTMPRDLFINDNRLEKLNSENNASTAENYAYQMYKQVREVTRRVIANTKQQVQYMSTQYDKKVKGPFFKVGDHVFLLVNVPSHKYSERWTGPYLIIHKINDWNYIINYNGQEKIVNIEKLKEYKLSKYSSTNSDSEQLRPTTPISDKSTNIFSKNPSHLDEDSESDSEITISIPSSTSAQQGVENHSQANNHGSLTNQSSNNDTPISHSVNNDQPEIQQPSQCIETSESTVTPNSPATALNQPINESDNDDDREAFYDANTSLDVNEQQDNQPGSSTDRRDLTLPDIDRHGRKRGIKVPRTAKDLSRSDAEEDLTTVHRSNPRYDIRPRVTGVKRYGLSSPYQTLKKKITKEKASKK
jgi:transposase InsO family protein